jgi:hypothetical protein
MFCLSYQAVTIPSSLIAQLYGPVGGRRHDAYVFWESGIEEDLKELVDPITNENFVIYGDAAYGLDTHVMKPYLATVPGSLEAKFNSQMSSARITSEWGFGMITNLFTTCDFSRQQKIYQTSPEHMYKAATLFLNMRTCMRGRNQTSDYFRCHPPSLDNYLHGVW